MGRHAGEALISTDHESYKARRYGTRSSAVLERAARRPIMRGANGTTTAPDRRLGGALLGVLVPRLLTVASARIRRSAQSCSRRRTVCSAVAGRRPGRHRHRVARRTAHGGVRSRRTAGGSGRGAPGLPARYSDTRPGSRPSFGARDRRWQPGDDWARGPLGHSARSEWTTTNRRSARIRRGRLIRRGHSRADSMCAAASTTSAHVALTRERIGDCPWLLQ